MTHHAIRKVWTQIEEVRLAAGARDDHGPLRKVAVCAAIPNPYADGRYHEDLSKIIEISAGLGTFLGTEAARVLGAPVEGYGKGGLAGTAGEQEHINAALTSVFGDAFRAAIGGGAAWISSVTKVAAAGATVDIPLAYKDDVWVRSHYDAVQVTVPDAPLPDELLVIATVANRGRLNARLGGRTLEEARS